MSLTKLFICDQAIRKVASPPNPLKRATISGIEVIFTLTEIIAPMIPPKRIATRAINGLTSL